MAKKAKMKSMMKRAVVPKGKFILERGFISAGGRMIGPGDSFTADDISPERLAELKEKGLIKGVLTTEEKGTITK